MRVETRFCQHCGTPYRYLASGGSPFEKPDSDDRHCPTCYSAIKAALSKIDKKYEWVFQPSLAHTVKEIEDQHAKIAKAYKDAKVVMPRRLYAGLINMENPNIRQISNYAVMPDGFEYHYSYWSNESPDKAVISRRAYVCIATGEVADSWPINKHPHGIKV